MTGLPDNLQAAKDFATGKLTRFAHVQTMSRSHVGGGFWLGGASALSPHLLQGKNQVAFEYKGQHWPVVFMQEKAGFSGGWRQCAIDNGLLEGDVVVYEVVSPDRLKLYFFRSKDWKGSRRPSLESMQYEDAPAINWNGRKPINMVEGRAERGTPGNSAGGGSKSAAAPKSQKSRATGSRAEPERGTPAAATPGGKRGASSAPSLRIRIKLPSSKHTTAGTAPSSPLPSNRRKHESEVAMHQDEEPAPHHAAAGPSSPPAPKRQRRGSTVALQQDEDEECIPVGAEAAGQRQRHMAFRGGGARAAAEGAGIGRSPKSKSLMDLVHSSPTVQLQCVEDGLGGGSSGDESEGGDEGDMEHRAGIQRGSREGGTALQRRLQQRGSRKGGDDGDKDGVQKRGSREGGTRLNVSSRGRKEAGMKTGVSVGASEGQKGQRGKGGGAGDEGGSQKAAKRRAQGSERDGSGAERAERTVQPEHHEHGGGGSRDGIHKKVTAGKGSRVLDAQVLGGTGVEGEPQAKKSVAIKRPGLPSPKGLSKAKKSVGSGVAVGVKSSAGKAQGTQPGKTSHARLDKKGSRAGGEGKRKGGSAEEGGGSKGKDKGSKRSEGGPPKKKQALQQSKEAGQPEVARFPKRRRANAQPIEGKQMGLDGEEALQGFWNIEEPEYDCEGLLHDIRAVAKAEVRPVVVDEASGNCIHAPHTLTISGSLGSGWTYDPQTGYFPVRFVNRDGYYIRLEDGT